MMFILFGITEPLLRLLVEAENDELLEKKVIEITKIINDIANAEK
jgi:phosphomannomutase